MSYSVSSAMPLESSEVSALTSAAIRSPSSQSCLSRPRGRSAEGHLNGHVVCPATNVGKGKSQPERETYTMPGFGRKPKRDEELLCLFVFVMRPVRPVRPTWAT